MPQVAVTATPMKATALHRPLASLACRMQDRKHCLDVEAKLRKKGCGPAREEQHLTIRDRPSFCSPENLDVPMVVTGALNIPPEDPEE